MIVAGADGGGSRVKTACEKGVDIFASNLIPFRELQYDTEHDENDMIIEYKDKVYFGGPKAKREDLYKSGTISGETKNHEEGILRILIGIHRMIDDGDNAKIVVSQPINGHKKEETDGIVIGIRKVHELTINSIMKKFEVDEVQVAPEGASAFWCQPEDGVVCVIDAGSGTVNCARFEDQVFINAKSRTLPFGIDSNDEPDIDEIADPEQIALAIVRRQSKKWRKRDKIRVVGGGANSIFPIIQKHFVNASVFHPIFNGSVHDPVFATAIGNYFMAKAVYL